MRVESFLFCPRFTRQPHTLTSHFALFSSARIVSQIQAFTTVSWVWGKPNSQTTVERATGDISTLPMLPPNSQTTLDFPSEDTATLLLLPTELLLLIASVLPDSSAVALTQSCQRFRYTFSMNVENLFDRFHSSSESTTRLCDQKIYKAIIHRSRLNDAWPDSTSCQPQRYYRNACRIEHDRKDFSMPSWSAPADERRCLKDEGLLWNCPLSIWSYEEAISQAGDCNELYCYTHSQSDIHGLRVCKEHSYTNFYGIGIRFPIDVCRS